MTDEEKGEGVTSDWVEPGGHESALIVPVAEDALLKKLTCSYMWPEFDAWKICDRPASAFVYDPNKGKVPICTGHAEVCRQLGLSVEGA